MTRETEPSSKGETQGSWFHFHGSDRSAENKIRADLAVAGVILYPLQNPPEGGGIICFSQVESQLFDLLGSLRRETRGSIIALAAPAIVVEPGTTWRLLAQGAS